MNTLSFGIRPEVAALTPSLDKIKMWQEFAQGLERKGAQWPEDPMQRRERLACYASVDPNGFGAADWTDASGKKDPRIIAMQAHAADRFYFRQPTWWRKKIIKEGICPAPEGDDNVIANDAWIDDCLQRVVRGKVAIPRNQMTQSTFEHYNNLGTNPAFVRLIQDIETTENPTSRRRSKDSFIENTSLTSREDLERLYACQQRNSTSSRCLTDVGYPLPENREFTEFVSAQQKTLQQRLHEIEAEEKKAPTFAPWGWTTTSAGAPPRTIPALTKEQVRKYLVGLSQCARLHNQELRRAITPAWTESHRGAVRDLGTIVGDYAEFY